MTIRILIIESNPPDKVAAGLSDAVPFVETFAALGEDVATVVAEPYETPFDPAGLAEADGVIFTGSGVEWSADDARAEPLADAMRAVFKAGLPVWGSCNGMQLAAAVLGGEVGVSPKGSETGMARGVLVTGSGQDHPMMAGRQSGFAVPCIHRDEVQRLPAGAVLLAGNAHSTVQAFVYDREGVDFWGTQYHPEFSGQVIADILASRPDPSPEALAFAADLRAADTDPQAAARLGAAPEALQVAQRATELVNWLAHVRARSQAAG